MIDPLVVALAFGAIFVVELPDKTFIATLVMSTKMRPLFVWIGVGLAFLVQTAIAVGIGKAASFLPEQLIHTVAALMFLVAKYDDPVSVFIGSWGALLAVSGLAVIVGRLLLQRVRLSVLHYVGAAVCVSMAALTVWEMTR